MNESPMKEIIEKYKAHLRKNGLGDELYKWELLAEFKGRPDTDAVDLYKELKSTKFYNLIYGIGIATSRHLAKERSAPYRKCLKELFDETIPIAERIINFNERTLLIYREIVPDKKLSHHQDERTIATFLTYHNPDKYTFYKNSFYKKYCKLIGIKPKRKNEKYAHYLSLIEEFIEKYIRPDEELITLFRTALPEDVYQDLNYNILAQNILYCCLDKGIGIKRKYWRVGTTAEGRSYWELMKQQSRVAIGWSEIGDLDEKDIEQKEDIQPLLEGFYPKDNRTQSRKAGEIFQFYDEINLGDIILSQDGDMILGIGVVTDEYIYHGDAYLSHQRQVDWRILNPNIKNKKGRLTTVNRLSDLLLIREIDKLLKDTNIINNDISENMNFPLNQILFGPPGTGKTYHSKSMAVEIIDGIVPESRVEVNQRYADLYEKKQIQFVTFHQSMSYEDFIEGIKPVLTSEDDEVDTTDIRYKIEDGIFKTMCIDAANEYGKLQAQESEPSKAVSFNQLFNTLLEEYQAIINRGEEKEIKLKADGSIFVEDISSQGNPILKHKNGKRSYTVSQSRLEKLYNKIEDFDTIPNIYSYFRSIIGGSNASAYWAILNELYELEKQGIPTSDMPIVQENKAMAYQRINWSKVTEDQKVPRYLLIIDEINRGNISAILGELITLLEPDKRGGKKEKIEVTLPYSKTKFIVPPNLFIIGTMNTADRSVEALDTALRRRFVFKEMGPKPGLLSPKNMILRLWNQEAYEKLGWEDKPFAAHAEDLYGFLGIDKNEAEGEFRGSEEPVSEPDKWTLSDFKNLDDNQFKGINLEKLLTTINIRIRKLIDKDHQIGHTYFMKLDNKEDYLSGLRAIFQNELLPLLQEYFYGNFGKIQLVLGKYFVYKMKEDITRGFAQDVEYGKDEYSTRDIFTIRDLSDTADFDYTEFKNAIIKIYHLNNETTTD